MLLAPFRRVSDLVPAVLGGGWREGGQAALWPGALLLLGTCLQSAVGMRVLVCAGVCVTVRAGAHGIPCAPCRSARQSLPRGQVLSLLGRAVGVACIACCTRPLAGRARGRAFPWRDGARKSENGGSRCAHTERVHAARRSTTRPTTTSARSLRRDLSAVLLSAYYYYIHLQLLRLQGGGAVRCRVHRGCMEKSLR